MRNHAESALTLRCTLFCISGTMHMKKKFTLLFWRIQRFGVYTSIQLIPKDIYLVKVTVTAAAYNPPMSHSMIFASHYCMLLATLKLSISGAPRHLEFSGSEEGQRVWTADVDLWRMLREWKRFNWRNLHEMSGMLSASYTVHFLTHVFFFAGAITTFHYVSIPQTNCTKQP